MICGNLVREAGFEPAATWFQTTDATRLHHSLKIGANSESRTRLRLLGRQGHHRYTIFAWSPRKELHPRHLAYKASALLTELLGLKFWVPLYPHPWGGQRLPAGECALNSRWLC